MKLSPTAHFTSFQDDRRAEPPMIPDSLKAPAKFTPVNVDFPPPSSFHQSGDSPVDSSSPVGITSYTNVAGILETINRQFPNTKDQPYLSREAQLGQSYEGNQLNIGVILSGGQAPGGHNVIAGIFDHVKRVNENGKVYGFRNGPHGLFTHNYVEIMPGFMNLHRNMGGFDMICSGRHKIESMEHKRASLEICKKLELDGLIIIGGDDSNTNAAVLAEFFKANGCETVVIGCPKTIDGDLKNEFVEASFGFDTACKTYSECIGNLARDLLSCKDRYHFVRVMGRSASHIALECALQTRPNLVFIGEEVQAERRSLGSIVEEIMELVIERAKLDKHYGLVIVPEGLIEFIPEFGVLIQEINDLLAHGSFDVSKLSEASKNLYSNLPMNTAKQLLFDRDPHGNVQVSKIATEELLIEMVELALEKRSDVKFNPVSHFMGYEGRCALPSRFDSNYCYSLGLTAAELVQHGSTGYMAVVGNLKAPPSEWTAGGCPLVMMMDLEKRHGEIKPVIKKYLVELDKAPFSNLDERRQRWRTEDNYRFPGPIQFSGPTADFPNFSTYTRDYDNFSKKSTVCNVTKSVAWSKETIGVVLVGENLPAVQPFVDILRSSVHTVVLQGAKGLISGNICLGVIERTRAYEPMLMKQPESITQVLYGVDKLVVLHDKLDLVTALKDVAGSTKIIPVDVRKLSHHSVVHTVSQLTGNLLIDDRSALKYWYFARVPCGEDSRIAIEVQNVTHATLAAAPETLAAKSMNDIVNTIAKCVVDRASIGSNFGTVLVPDTLIKQLSRKEVEAAVALITEKNYKKIIDGTENVPGELSDFFESLGSMKNTLVKAIAKDPMSFWQIVPTERFVAELVAAKLNEMNHKGFSPVTLSFSAQMSGGIATISDVEGATSTVDRILHSDRFDGLFLEDYNDEIKFNTMNQQVWINHDYFTNPGPIQLN